MLSRRMDEMGLNIFSLDTIHQLDNIIVEGKHENDFEHDSTKYAVAAYEALRASTITCINTIINGHLYLGSKEQARRHYVLAAIGITDVMVMAQCASEPGEAEAFAGSNIRFWDANIPDILGLSFISVLRAVLHLIQSRIFTEPSRDFEMKDIGNKNEKFKCENGRVLFVHCIQGVSRSAAVVVGYLMYRLYVTLPLGNPIFDFWELITAVKECRHCCPNLTFMTNLFFLWESLKVMSQATVLRDGENLPQVRQAEFDKCLQLGEVYFESHTRCLSETFGFLHCEVLTALQEGMKRVEKQGLTALSLKKSLLRDSKYWLSRAVFLRSLNVYMMNIAPGSLELGTIAWEEAYERMLIRNGFVSEAASSVSTSILPPLMDPLLEKAGIVNPQNDTLTSGIAITRVPLHSAKRLSGKEEPLKLPIVPPCLFYEMLDSGIRYNWLRVSLGLTDHVPESTWNDFSPSRVLQLCVASGLEVAKLCQRLTGMFGCRTWSLWLMAMIERDCQELRKNCLGWLNVRKLAPPADQALGVIAPSVALAGPDLNKSSPDLASEAAEGGSGRSKSHDRRKAGTKSPLAGSPRERKRRMRYEDVTVDVLRREIDRAKHKLKRIRCMLGEA